MKNVEVSLGVNRSFVEFRGHGHLLYMHSWWGLVAADLRYHLICF